MLLDFCLGVVVIVVVFGAMCLIGDGVTIVEIVDPKPVVAPRCQRSGCYNAGTILAEEIDGTPRLVCPGDNDDGKRRGWLR